MAWKTLSNVREKQLCEIFHDKVSYVGKKFARSARAAGHFVMPSMPDQMGISFTYINVKSMESRRSLFYGCASPSFPSLFLRKRIIRLSDNNIQFHRKISDRKIW